MQLGSGEEAEYDLGEEKDGGKTDAKKGRDKVQPLDSFEFGGSETHSEDAERGNNNSRKVSIKCPRKAPPTWRQMQSGGRYEERRGVGGNVVSFFCCFLLLVFLLPVFFFVVVFLF